MLIRLVLLAGLYLHSFTAFGQENALHPEAPTHWRFIPLPVAGYSTEKGFSFGIFSEITEFASTPGSSEHNILNRITLDASYSTLQSGYIHLVYHSERLLKNFGSGLSISYLTDRNLPFYGFNGYNTLYHKDLPGNFYSHHRDLLRIVLDVNRKIEGNLYWMGGLSVYQYNTGSPTGTHQSLFDVYKEYGVIGQEESLGGSALLIKTGLAYDTRDNPFDPLRGTFSEILISAGLTSGGAGTQSHWKLSMIFRHYLPVRTDRTVLAFRIAWQGNLAGNPPFFMQNNLQSTHPVKAYQDGIGGALSVRGVLPNRMVGNGMLWSNWELRQKLFLFRFIGKQWDFAANPFLDTGMVVQSYRKCGLESLPTLYYNPGRETLHCAIGIGLKAIMENNFVVSGEFGKALDARDGNYGLYFGLNYLF